MTEMQQRSLLERLIGKPLPWLAWTWAGLAVVWIVLTVVDPTDFHVPVAIVWSVLAVIRLGGVYNARRQERRRMQALEAQTIAH
ncbi:hypothetical protein [Curtobacterium sp. VKM Ac-1393]|uniref:hypothetical protein n=1 Tax=Curtobacterium sp. VKM Ac-1393 TaxID=2783814 RepID=UPI00188C5E91|nr:hypothetical protein [Curtobacterium sp. VKM Ac-1393]MBF4606665.1 hypothetical protein [Curtobacterium sp. VKM Ac-1393]